MMEPKSRIFEGKTLEEAVRKGLESFGLSRAEVMITTMQEGSGGFFGFGGRPFRVRIQARPGGAPRDVEERAPRAERGGRDRGGRGDRERGGRGGRDRGARGGDRERGGRGERGGATPARGGRGESRREAARAPQARGPERERGGRGRGGSAERSGSGERERSNERERSGSAERECGNERERVSERERNSSNERERREAAPPTTPESQPPVGARGFEDRRRPGDRREEEGDTPRGGDRRSGEDRRQMAGANAGEPGGDGRRRRRRGRRGGRGRRRGGAELPNALETPTPPVGPATAEAMASDLPTDLGASEPRRFEEPVRAEHEPSPAPEPYVASAPAEPTPFASAPDDFDALAASFEPPARSFETPTERTREPRAPREPREYRSAPTLSGDELAATSRKVTEDLFKAMGFDGKVTATLSGPDKVDVMVEVSDDEELLTGRKGETRQALQHLLNRIVNKGEGSRYHLQLEINDFWKRREEELAELARGMAERAAATGEEQVSDFLNAQERRIIHVTLREDARVKTYALGDGMIKRLAVAPAHAETMGGGES